MLNYSVIIRTTGKAGEKYSKLLESIKNLEPQPEEIIVVLPEGYSPPKETLGREKFYYCPKGMVIQRLYGISQCTTQYALITDDDIAFSSDFVMKLYRPLAEGKYGFSAGPLLNFFPKPGIQTLFAALTGIAVPTFFHSNHYNTVLKTTGYSFNRKIDIHSDRIYETQSAPWTCFFADMQAMRSIHFEDELWLDKHGYSAHDDTAMFYKAWLCGQKAVIVSNACYDHLDAGTSRIGNRERVEYSSGFNTVVFWHRFLFMQAPGIRKQWCRICLFYRVYSQRLFNLVNRIRGRLTKAESNAFVSGVSAGKRWILSEEYTRLPALRFRAAEEPYE